jgi:hypothetical protein
MKLQIAVLATIIAGAVAIPASASASTPECTSGTYTGYCGTQANNGSPVLVMDNSKQRTAINNPRHRVDGQQHRSGYRLVPACLCG